MKGSSPPPAPDYVGAARAQGAANVDAARVESRLNNPNVVSPYGTQTVQYGAPDIGRFNQEMAVYDEAVRRHAENPLLSVPARPTLEQFAGNPDTPTITQTLSPEQQVIYNQQTSNQQGLGSLANQGIGAARGIIGSRLDYSGVPAAPGDYNSLRAQVYDAMMARPNEDLGIKRDNTNSELIAAGIRPGSKAYDNAMHMIDRQQTDAQQQAIINAGNQAQQAYGMDMQRRQQGLAEQLAQRQVPLNEITALMSGSQTSNPFQMPGYAQNANVQPAPIYNATTAAGQYQTDVYNANQARNSANTAGLVGLGGTALMTGAMMF